MVGELNVRLFLFGWRQESEALIFEKTGPKTCPLFPGHWGKRRVFPSYAPSTRFRFQTLGPNGK